MRCKGPRPIENETITPTKRGAFMVRGTCAICKTKICKLTKAISEVGPLKEEVAIETTPLLQSPKVTQTQDQIQTSATSATHPDPGPSPKTEPKEKWSIFSIFKKKQKKEPPKTGMELIAVLYHPEKIKEAKYL
jgi:hypothetical protein